MTLLGHAGARGRVVALWLKVPRIRSAMEVGAVREHLDLRVPDRVALDEIELYAEVLSAVAISDRPLTAEELDAVLGTEYVPGTVREPWLLHCVIGFHLKYSAAPVTSGCA
jgi:hypothetical protein